MAPPDDVLAQAVRDGDAEAFGRLVDRHRAVAEAIARSRAPACDVDDVVAEAFLAVFVQLRAGAGPTADVGAYVRRVVVNETHRRHRMAGRVSTDEDVADLLEPSPDHAGPWFESTTVARAYRRLPQRYREVLLQIDVEGRSVGDVAQSAEVPSGRISTTLHRARRALRAAYLVECLGSLDAVPEACRPARQLLPSDVRGSLGRRQQHRVHQHLTHCADCQEARSELARLDQELDAWFLPTSVYAVGASLGVAGVTATGLAGTVALSLLGVTMIGLVAGAVFWAVPPESAEADAAPPTTLAGPRSSDDGPGTSRTAPRRDDETAPRPSASDEAAQPAGPPAPATAPPDDRWEESDWTRDPPQIGDRFTGGTPDVYEVRHVERETESSRGEDRDVDPPAEHSSDGVLWEREYEEVVRTRSVVDLAIEDEAERWETLCDGTLRERTLRAVVEETVTTLHRIGHRTDDGGQRVEVRETKELDRTFSIGAVLGNPPVECLPEDTAPAP